MLVSKYEWGGVESVGAYHERERLCPEGVRVREIAHVHYACESYAGWHRGVPMASHATKVEPLVRRHKGGGVAPPSI